MRLVWEAIAPRPSTRGLGMRKPCERYENSMRKIFQSLIDIGNTCSEFQYFQPSEPQESFFPSKRFQYFQPSGPQESYFPTRDFNKYFRPSGPQESDLSTRNLNISGHLGHKRFISHKEFQYFCPFGPQESYFPIRTFNIPGPLGHKNLILPQGIEYSINFLVCETQADFFWYANQRPGSSRPHLRGVTIPKSDGNK